ncbi:MAG: sigma factor-like helix-turn-helix DNA-binding protein [Terracidiphilus sp.]|nr:sigma factor-like helix-turn-helix DNA-binding protein [Terracidiphilus sp.]
MSAALQLPIVWGTSNSHVAWQKDGRTEQKKPPTRAVATPAKTPAAEPEASLAFYRKHTEGMLRRYLYASMQVGRAPSILGDPIGRGWVSSRPVRTFEDAVIFVLDVETCLNKLGSLDRQMLSRIVLQEYTQAEAANLLGMSVRTISYKFPKALDRLTEKLLEADLLVLPQ